MWEVMSGREAWWCADMSYDRNSVRAYFPPCGMSTRREDNFGDVGTAITMCDILNAQDYPEEFAKENYEPRTD